MSLLTDFKKAQLDIRRNRTVIVPHSMRLKLAGLFRQAELGDNAEKKPNSMNIIAMQKWTEHNKHKGKSKDEAMTEYIELVNSIIHKEDESAKKKLPPLFSMRDPIVSFRMYSSPKASFKKPKKAPSIQKIRDTKDSGGSRASSGLPSVLQSDVSRSRRNASLAKSKLRKTETENSFTEVTVTPALPPLPPISDSKGAKQDEGKRAQLFRSRHFSSILGTTNPLNEDEDLQKKFMLYEKLRSFYVENDPDRIKRGLGAIVEWTMTHGEAKLNEALRKKYGTDLIEFEKKASKVEERKRNVTRLKTRQQLALSQRLVETKDVATRKKMDKLTRFLLVNDPELVSHGMFLMMKFIENKGLGALNDNLKKNYGKSLDSVTDEELNTELKKKYGNDLEMLEKPLFGDKRNSTASADESVIDETLQDQILHIDREKFKQKARQPSADYPKPKVSAARTTETSFDERAYTQTLSSPNKKNHNFMDDFNTHKKILGDFLEIYEPYRFNEAFELIGNFMKKYGVDEVNRKLRKKYDVDLTTFQTINISDVDGKMTEDEFNVRVLQFVTKHEKPKNIQRAVSAMTSYKKKQGLAALNTKLFIKYGETLNDVEEDEVSERGLSMAELHKVDLPEGLKEKLKVFYAKYDPTVLGSRGIDRIFQWAETNGVSALDKQLKAKYKESLTEFCDSYDMLKEELERFYTVVDPKKLENNQLETVLSWALVNGRDALNYNLRKKYKNDLTMLDNETQGTLETNASPDI